MKHLKLFASILSICLLSSCFGDLDTAPTDPDIITSETFFKDEAAYRQVLAKVYAGLATTGQQGPAGSGDLGGLDEGFSNYTRQLWYQQELTTDEAVCGWNDNTIADFHDLDWTSTDVFINGFYNRVFYQVGVCNEFLRQTKPEVLERRETSADLTALIETFRYEVRFMRALSYWHGLDAFRNVPFTTEEDPVGSFFPEQIKAADLFNFIESELLDIEDKIGAVNTAPYARADQGAVWAVLAKLYLNAEVYLGTPRYGDCLTYCEKLINSGYELDEEYEHLFLADNQLSNEVIFPVAVDGNNTQSWGGTTFIIHASVGGILNPRDQGVDDGWGGIRSTPQMFEKFGAVGDGTITPFGESDPSLTTFFISQKVDGVFEVNYSGNQLASIGSDKVFEGYRYFNAEDEFVFKTTSGFGAKTLGDDGNDGTADVNGAPLVIASEGLYRIAIDRNVGDGQIILEKVNLAVVGSGIEGGSTPLFFDTESGLMKAEGQFLDGTITIESQDASINLGAGATPGTLMYGGSGISTINTPGEIFLDLNRPTYLYSTASTSFDRRAIFGTEGQSKDIASISEFTGGYPIHKFKNIDRNGDRGVDGTHVDTDFPLFRLADFYLMAAESILRGAPGSKDDAASYFNKVRQRAYKSTLANLTADELNLQEIIDERARELSWEAHRRTDLIRFNQFTTSDYLWSWKGGVQEGRAVEPFRRVFPIPSSDLNNNPNLSQNEGYN